MTRSTGDDFGENEREEVFPPEGAGDGMNLLIGRRADKEEAAFAPDRHRRQGRLDCTARPPPFSYRYA